MRVKYVNWGPNQRAVRFFCPGCQESHMVVVEGPGAWAFFNHDLDAPTIRESVLVRSGHYAQPEKKECYCNYSERYPDKEPLPPRFVCRRCHSFVTDGKIQFLSDCTHALVNQTVELPELTTHEENDL